jgi:periplasmic copper chaperone A
MMVLRTAAMRAALLFGVALTACTPSAPISVDNAWVRAPAPGLDVAAGYLDIVNHGAAAVDLIGARTDAARIELHTHIHAGDMMQMRKVDAVTLPPGETVAFAPGGRHLMLFDFRAVTSNRIPITLLFSDTTQQTVLFEIRTASGATQP